MVETCWNPLIGSKYWHVCGTYSHLHSQIHQSKTVCFQWLKVNQTIDAYYAHPQGFHLHHWALATRDGCHAAVCHAGLRSQGRYCEEPPVLWFFVDGNNQSLSIWDGFPTLFHGFPTVFHRFPTIFPRKSVLLVKIEGPGAGKPMENNLFLKGFVQTPLFITQRANGGFSMSQPVKLPVGTQTIGSILGVDGPTETGFRNEPTFLLGSNHSYNLSGYMDKW